MYYEDAINRIIDYFKKFSKKPTKDWSDQEIKEYSYVEYTLSSLIDEISNNPFEDSIDVLYSCIMDIEYLKRTVKSAKSRLIFKIALETCRNVLENFEKETKLNEKKNYIHAC